MTGGKGVVVNAALTSSGIGNLIRLNATTGDVNINAAVTASASGASVQLNAGHDVNINAATGSIAGGVVTASGGGAIAFVSDTLGVPGPTGGAVNICAGCAVTSTNVTVYYSPPNGYGSPTPYTGFTAHEWVFVQADNKIYDATTAATARFYGDPTVGGTVVVGLTGGAISFVDKNVGVAKPVTFSGYSINGSGAAAYALFAGAGSTNAAITPAPLSVTANSTSKVYGQTTSLATTAFTSAGLKGSDTIAGVTEVSPGAAATGAVSGSPCAITPSNAVGGSYISSNYTTTYLPGILTITPAAVIVTANNAAKTYGQGITFAPAAFTSSGLQNGDTIAGVTETSPGAVATAAVAGSPYAITPSSAVGGTYVPANYNTTYRAGSLIVTPAVLTVTADDAVKTFGQAISFPTTAFTSTGLQNGDTIAGVTETSPGASPTATLAGSPYTITASNAVGGSYVPTNYTTTYASGVLVTLPGVTPPVVTSPVVGVTPLDPTTPGVTPPVAVTPVAVTPFGTTLGATTTPGATSAESTPVVTPQVETLPTFATLEGTRPLVTSTGSSVGAPTGFPLVVVGQGVNKPVIAAAAASPATVFPAPAMPVIGEYPRKPDRN